MRNFTLNILKKGLFLDTETLETIAGWRIIIKPQTHHIHYAFDANYFLVVLLKKIE